MKRNNIREIERLCQTCAHLVPGSLHVTQEVHNSKLHWRAEASVAVLELHDGPLNTPIRSVHAWVNIGELATTVGLNFGDKNASFICLLNCQEIRNAPDCTINEPALDKILEENNQVGIDGREERESNARTNLY